MSEAAKRTLDWRPPIAALNERASDPHTMRLRWRLLTRPARSNAEPLSLRATQATRAVEQQMRARRWRPMSAPSSPVPPWRWPGRARAERASQRAAISERWRPLTAR
jgi:hypothetical protein